MNEARTFNKAIPLLKVRTMALANKYCIVFAL